MRGKFGPRTKDTVDKANQLLDNFSNILKKEGLKLIDQTQLILIKKHLHLIGKLRRCLDACHQEMFC